MKAPARPGDRVYLERHPDVYGLAGDPVLQARRLAAAAGVSEQVDWPRALAVLAAAHGVARDVTAAPGADVAHHDRNAAKPAPNP